MSIPRFLRLNAITRAPRGEVLLALDEALSRAGTWVLQHNLYSNISVALVVTLEAGSLPELARELGALPLSLYQESRAALEQASAAAAELPEAQREQELHATIEVLFVHDDPDLRHEVPSVPG